MPIRTSAFLGVSLDGFIARVNGDIDWLPHDTGEDFGYDAFIATVDAIVLGRKSYEKVLTFDRWYYGTLRTIVLSSRPLAPAPEGARVERMAGEPSEIVAALEAQGLRHLYVDGGVTVQRFIRAGLLDRLTLTWVPVLIGTGTPLFGPTGRDIALTHVETRSFPSGLVQAVYDVRCEMKVESP